MVLGLLHSFLWNRFGVILVPLSTESSLSMAVLHCEQQRWGAEPFLLSVQWCLSWRMPRTDTAAGAVLLVLHVLHLWGS